MLHFLQRPIPGDGLEVVIIVKHVAEISGVVAAVIFDKGGRLDELDDVGIDRGRLEVVPGNLIEGPMRHDWPLLPLLSQYPELGPPEVRQASGDQEALNQ